MTEGPPVEVVKRAPLFELLRDGPRDTPELVDGLDMSRSTVHRTTRSFAERGLLRETEAGFELTGFGRTVADTVAAFRNQISAANELCTFLNTVEPADVEFPLDSLADATVIRPKPHQPHFAVKRIIELIETSDTLRMISSVISPFYVDVAHREMMDGTEIEVVFDQQVVEIVASEYADEATEAAATGRFEVYVRDGVPFEMFVLDDRVGMAAHDGDGIARVFVESEMPAAVEWAEVTYKRYRENASRIDVDRF